MDFEILKLSDYGLFKPAWIVHIAHTQLFIRLCRRASALQISATLQKRGTLQQQQPV